MEYAFIFGAQIFGILFHIGQTIVGLDKSYPEKTIKEILYLFFDNEWSSMGVSIVILLFHLFAHGFLDYYKIAFTRDSFTFPGTLVEVPYILVSFIVGLVFGYGGQTLAYKYLGKAKQYLSTKAD